MTDSQILGRQILEEIRDRLTGHLRKNERDEETGVEIAHRNRLAISIPLVPNLTKQLGRGTI